MQNVEAFVTANSLALSRALEEFPGLELVRPFDPRRVSGIVSFRPPGGDPARIHSALKSRQLSCAVRGDAIRLSPHFYQLGQPVQEMLSVITEVIA